MFGPHATRLYQSFGRVPERGTRTAVVGAVYRPPDAPAASLADLRGQLEDVISLNKPLFLLGDLNLDILHLDKPGVRHYVTMLHDLGLHQLIQQPTHPAPGSEELRELQSRRDVARRARDVTGSADAKQRYRALKREFTGRLRTAKADFFKASPTETSKKTWSRLKKYAIANKPSKSADVMDPTTADHFNEHFAAVGQRVAAAWYSRSQPQAEEERV
ncbi:hypothetical protein FJT64_009140 [Amphibalanus amphitrite]|uniref:Endonuclease/exonuclease/phosphatase domain-containing protein n=1 Tax=Amphibalanus amphitrite TaxID=1232801 RepID=A0A6A4VQH3_AMPAM|nr:hypothetical protein FJT64_009140 [Amphibalanus amphitrite]